MNLPHPGETGFSNRGYRSVLQITIKVVPPHSLAVMSNPTLPRLSGARPAPSAAATSALGAAILVALVALLAAPALVVGAALVALAVVAVRRALRRGRGRRAARDALADPSPR